MCKSVAAFVYRAPLFQCLCLWLFHSHLISRLHASCISISMISARLLLLLLVAAGSVGMTAALFPRSSHAPTSLPAPDARLVREWDVVSSYWCSTSNLEDQMIDAVYQCFLSNVGTRDFTIQIQCENRVFPLNMTKNDVRLRICHDQQDDDVSHAASAHSTTGRLAACYQQLGLQMQSSSDSSSSSSSNIWDTTSTVIDRAAASILAHQQIQKLAALTVHASPCLSLRLPCPCVGVGCECRCATDRQKETEKMRRKCERETRALACSLQPSRTRDLSVKHRLKYHRHRHTYTRSIRRKDEGKEKGTGLEERGKKGAMRIDQANRAPA